MARATRALGFDPGAEQGGDTRHASSTDPSNRKQANAGDPERGRGGTTHTHITDFSRSIVMVSKSVIACALVAASGTVASAGVFSWSAGNGSWGDHTNWSGPAGQVPHLTVDSASVGVQHADVLIESSIALGSLHVFGGASVYTHTGSLFVNGDVLLEESNQALVVSDGPAARDFDADTVTVRDTYMVMAGGTVQIDETFQLETAGVLGAGVVEMNGSGDFDLGHGTLWATHHPSGDVLTVRRTGSSTARLDWTDPSCNILAWSGTTLDIQMPVRGALAGGLSISERGTVRFADPIVAGGGSQLALWGGDVFYFGTEAVLEAPIVDIYGSLEVASGESIIRSPFVALRGTAEFREDTYLRLESTAVILDSLVVTSPNGTGGNLHFDGTQAVSVIGGTTSFSTGQFGLFDLDGSGDMAVSIAGDSALLLDVHHIQSFQIDTFSGTLNVAGLFHLETYQGAPTWQNQGEINLDGGEITGRTLENEGVISGSGSIERLGAQDSGQIVADGGTLDIGYLVNGHLKGDVSVETGDLRVNTTGNYDLIQVHGALVVGDGQAIQEVVETNNTLSVNTGSMSMNAGFVRAKNVHIHSGFATQGDSTLRTTGNGAFDYGVSFFPTGSSTVSGTLEINGGGRTYSGHTFQGEGLIRAAKVSEDFDFGHGSAMGDVSFAAAGVVSVNDYNNGIGQASVAGFELEPTATFRVDLGGPNAGTDHDSIAAMDAAVVGGTIEIGTANGYEPAIGQVATVLTAPSISGSFDAVDDSGLGWKRRAVVSVESDRVDVRIRCAADLNDDGLLDLSDVTMFTQAFTANDMLADLYVPHGLLDLSDALAFIEMFNTGCN